MNPRVIGGTFSFDPCARTRLGVTGSDIARHALTDSVGSRALRGVV
jgi:hypothetical protein